MPGNKKKCEHFECNKRISAVDTIMSSCNCGKQFCTIHRLSEMHKCSYNYKHIDISGEIDKLKCVSDRVSYI